MSQDDDSQKTEEPSQRKLDEARGRGDVIRAVEIKHAVMLGGCILIVTVLAGGAATRLSPLMSGLLGNAGSYALAPADMQTLGLSILGQMGVAVAPIFALLLGLALVAGLSQGRPTLSWEKVTPKFSKLSPLAGFKRLFGGQAWVEFAKTLAKVILVGTICVMVTWPHARRLELSLLSAPGEMLKLMSSLTVSLLLSVAIAAALLAAVDWVYQRNAFMKRMRMSRQELKDEHKQSEGDPHVKARLRQLRFEKSRKRMMAAVPTADVVITNPTHYAVALKYEHGAMGAPRVVAKGVDSLALRIRAKATEHDVPIVENPPLARTLYAAVEVDEDIQPDHYKAVAEVISYVLRLRKRLPQR